MSELGLLWVALWILEVCFSAFFLKIPSSDASSTAACVAAATVVLMLMKLMIDDNNDVVADDDSEIDILDKENSEILVFLKIIGITGTGN